MVFDIIFLIIGLTMIIVGANFLTDGSVAIARRFNVPELVIGLTIIAIGTSAPELVVSIVSAIEGNTEMAVGNVIGSNIFNSLVIIGATALIRPIKLSRENSFRNIPLAIATSIFFVIISSSVLGLSILPFKITKLEGIILLIGFIFFMEYTIRQRPKTKLTSAKSKTADSERVVKKMSIWTIPKIIGGLLGLIWGGEIFLGCAESIAYQFGVSEYIISVTLMAGGTSLPELAACIAAARKGKSQLALGNVIGSNISNILLVLGTAATITPLSLQGVTIVDLLMVLMSSALLFLAPFTFKRHQIDRIEGVLLIIVYISYVIYLLSK